MRAKPTLSKEQIKNIVSEVYKDHPEKKILLSEAKSSANWSEIFKRSVSFAGGAGFIYDLTRQDSQMEKIGRWMTDTLGFPTSTEAAEALGTEMAAFWVHSLSKFDLASGDQDYREIEATQQIHSNRPAMRYSIRMFDVKKDAIGAGKQLSSMTGASRKVSNPEYKYLSEIGSNSKLISAIEKDKQTLYKRLKDIYKLAVKRGFYKQEKIDEIAKIHKEGFTRWKYTKEERFLDSWAGQIWPHNGYGSNGKITQKIEKIIEDFDFEAITTTSKNEDGKRVKKTGADLSVLELSNKETFFDYNILHSPPAFLMKAFTKDVRKSGGKPPSEIPKNVLLDFGDQYEALIIRACPYLKDLYYKHGQEQGFVRDGKIVFGMMFEPPFSTGLIQQLVLDEVAAENKRIFKKDSNPVTDYFVINKSVANKDAIKKRHELAIQAAVQVGFEIAAVLALGPAFAALGKMARASAWAYRSKAIERMLSWSIAAMGIGTEIGAAYNISATMGDTVNKLQEIIAELQSVSNSFLEELNNNPNMVKSLMASYEDPDMAAKAEESLKVVEGFENSSKKAIENLEKLQVLLTAKVYEKIKTQAAKLDLPESELRNKISVGQGAGEGRFDAFQYNPEKTKSAADVFISWHKNPTKENKQQIINFFDMYISIASSLNKAAETLKAGQQEMIGHLKSLPPATSANQQASIREQSSVASTLGTVAKAAVDPTDALKASTDKIGSLGTGVLAGSLMVGVNELMAYLAPKGVKEIKSLNDFERYMSNTFNMPIAFMEQNKSQEVMNKAILDPANVKSYLDMKLKYTRKVQKTFTPKYREHHASIKDPEEAKRVGAFLFRPHIITIFDADALPNWNFGEVTFSFEFYNMKGSSTIAASKDAYRRFYEDQFKQLGLVSEFIKSLQVSQKALSKALISLAILTQLNDEVKTSLKNSPQKPVGKNSQGVPIISLQDADKKRIQQKLANTNLDQAVEYLKGLRDGSRNKNMFLTIANFINLMSDCVRKISAHSQAKDNLVNSAALAAQSLDKLIEFLVIMRK